MTAKNEYHTEEERKEDEEFIKINEINDDDMERTSASVVEAKKLYENGQLEKALGICERIYQLNPSRKDNLLLLGAIHYQLKDFSESIFYNQQAIRVDPNFSEAYSNLGNSLRELGDVKAATEFYLKAIKLQPRFSDAYNNLASTYLQMGQTKQAFETYQMALVLNPNLADAQSNMGNLLKAQGRLEDARKCYLEAIRIRPDFSTPWSNLAGIFKDEGDLETAISYYQEAIRLSPEFADAHSNLGNALHCAGKLTEAKSSFEVALKLRPDFAIAQSNLGNVYYDLGHMDKAIAAYKQAIHMEPNYPDVHNNLGNAYRDIGDDENALKRYRACIKLKPDHPFAYNNLGNLLRERGMIKEAIQCYMTACRLMPRFAAAHNNLGCLLKEQGKVDQAIAHFQECVATDSKFAAGFSNLGNTYKEINRINDAIKCFTTAIQLDPSFPNSYYNLGCAYKEANRLDDAISCFRKAIKLNPDFVDAKVVLAQTLAAICDWRERKSEHQLLKDIITEQLELYEKRKDSQNMLPILSVQPYDLFPMTQREIGGECELFISLQKAYAQFSLHTAKLLNFPKFSYRARLPSERLRVGYVSSNFGQFPVSFMLQSVFSSHNTKEIEIFCYSTSEDDKSRIRKNIEREAEHFRTLEKLSDYEAAQIINRDHVNILINLDGYSRNAKTGIFAFQPAPLQVSLPLGYCSSMCADFIQYTVVDKELAKSIDAKPVNNLLVLDRSVMISDHRQTANFVLDTTKCPTRAEYGLEEDKFVFASFCPGHKINPSTLDSWATILKKTPKSVMWLLRSPTLMEANIRAEFRTRGVPDTKVVFSDLVGRKEHLQRGYLADVYLDTPSFNSQTSAMDVLWAGTPILACTPPEGGKMAARVSASILREMGLNQLVTESMTDYENMAVDLANKSDLLWSLRKRIEEARLTSSLFNVDDWTRSFETGLKAIWMLYENGEPCDDMIL